MDYIKLGNSGLEVSKFGLGCMGFGNPQNKNTPWALDEETSRPIIKKALDQGINFFDTANIYSGGASEEVVGKVLRELSNREEIVLATKVFFGDRSGPNSTGLSRKNIFTEIDKSLLRLGTDYIDLYQIHRWDNGTPIEETMEALHDLIKAGKVRYIGASSMYAWQFSKAQYVAEKNGWSKFISMHNYYNLLYREEEREMIPLCKDQHVGLIPWSPLDRGRLARPWGERTDRSQKDHTFDYIEKNLESMEKEIIERVGKIAISKSTTRSQVALAWLFHKTEVTAPIVGATKIEHVEEAINALSLELSNDEICYLEETYTARPITGGLS